MNYFLKMSSKIKKNKIMMSKSSSSKKMMYMPMLNNVSKVFSMGDMITMTYWTKTILSHYEGMCLSLKNKFFKQPNVSVTLSNVLSSMGMELTTSYFLNSIFKNMEMSDYKRKSMKYSSSKLYYLRTKKNKASKIKGWI